MSQTSKLSIRQNEVLHFLAQGMRVDDISYRLNIRPVTVNLHIAKIRVKLNARTNAQAVAIAYQKNIIPTLA